MAFHTCKHESAACFSETKSVNQVSLDDMLMKPSLVQGNRYQAPVIKAPTFHCSKLI